MLKNITAVLVSVLLLSASVEAATVKGKVKGAGFRGGTAVLTGSSNGNVKTGKISSSGKFTLTVPTGNKYVYLDVRDSSGKVYPAFLKNCSSSSCKSSKLHPLVKSGARGLQFSAKSGRLLAGAVSPASWKTMTDSKKFVFGSKAATASNYGRLSGTSTKSKTSEDFDGDGLPGRFDIDADNDGVLNNYDASENGLSIKAEGDSTSFPVFSNFKLNLDESLNLHMGSLTQELIDAAMAATTSLAIGIVSAPGAVSNELDCGGLSYCSSGGTGRTSNGSVNFPDAMDADSDGNGEISAGDTGDFQLQTGAVSSEIGSGDTLIQIVTDGDGKAASIPAVLNFVFSTTPAIKNVAVSNGSESTEYTVDYSLPSNKIGGMNNPFIAPADGDVSVNITAWRPQRAGIASAGEAEYVDIGNSLVTIDIPNGPGVGGPEGSGPGNCAAASYSSTDPNLSADNNGLVDNAADAAADSANTFNFTINLSECLRSGHGGAIDWEAGEILAVDLQMKNSVGDNAAQKFYVRRGV